MAGRWLGLGVLAAGLVACTADSRGGEHKTSSVKSELTAPSTVRFAWGDGESQIGFRPAIRESLPLGAPAVALAKDGKVFILDALHERVVRATGGEIVKVATVPRDADDLAVGPDGAIAVRRSTTPDVLVFSPGGELLGKVDTSAVGDVDGIALGPSRRVLVSSPFQETYLVGSPSMPQLAAAVQANKREGAFLLPDGRGVVAVNVRGELELRVVAQDDDHTNVVSRFSLGKGEAARLVGVDRNVACARIEHADTNGPTGAIAVKREVACVDLVTGTTMLRKDLPEPGAYLPRRELSLSGGRVAFVRPTADGLEVTTWVVEGGAR